MWVIHCLLHSHAQPLLPTRSQGVRHTSVSCSPPRPKNFQAKGPQTQKPIGARQVVQTSQSGCLSKRGVSGGLGQSWKGMFHREEPLFNIRQLFLCGNRPCVVRSSTFSIEARNKDFCLIFPILSTISNKMSIHFSPNHVSESWMYQWAASVQLLIKN